MSSHSPGRGSLSKSLGRVFADAEALFDETWSTSSTESDETALENARHQIALLERSLASLEESERRARTRTRRRPSDGRRKNSPARTSGPSKNRPTPSRDSRRRRSSTPRPRNRPSVPKASGARPTRRLARGVDVASRLLARAETLSRALDELSGAGGRAIIGNLKACSARSSI